MFTRVLVLRRNGLFAFVLCVPIWACTDSRVEQTGDVPLEQATLPVLAPSNLETLDPGVAFVVQNAIERVQQNPVSPETRFELGMTFDANSLFEAALEAYEQTLQLAPDYGPAYYLGARMFRELGQLDNSRAGINRAIELEPTYAPAQRLSAEWHLQSGDFEAAETEYARVQSLQPDWPDGALGLARLSLLRDDAERALTLASEVAAKHPTDTYAQHLMGSALRDLGRSDESEAAFALAAGGVPTWNDPWVDEMETRLGGYSRIMIEAKACLDQGLYEEAVRRLAVLQEQTPDDVTLLGMWTAALTKLSRNDEALRLLLAARDRGVEHFRLDLNLAIVSWKQDQLDSALEHIGRAIELNSTHETIYLVKGQIHEARSEPDAAIVAFELALQFGSDAGRVLPRIGSLQMALERWELAAATYTRAVRAMPNDAGMHATLAGCLLEAGDRDGAHAAMTRAKQMDANHKLIPMVEARMAELSETKQP